MECLRANQAVYVVVSHELGVGLECFEKRRLRRSGSPRGSGIVDLSATGRFVDVGA